MMRFAVAALLFGAAAAASEAPAPEPAAAEQPTAEADAPTADSAVADETMAPRARYNLGLDQLAAEDYAAAAEAFLAARDDAGPDPRLRYRAAFNLGYALAQGVDGETPPAEAIETLRQSAAWFNDAVRLAPADDEDARVNLELVSRRILQLADQLNAGDKLQARLDRLIDDQRSLRDQLRGLLTDVAAANATAEPIGFKAEFDGLASRERTLTAEVGDCLDLAAEERLYIEQLPEQERTPEQQGRAYQLQGVADQLERARQSLSDARRRLRRLDGERAHRRADAALAELKRAREQLMDPLQVLQAVRRDELELMAHTAAKAAFDARDASNETPPPWLTARHLRERQEGIGTRTGGVLGQFDAVAAQAANAPAEGAPEQARLAAAIAEATPPLEEALAAMRTAIGALDAEDVAAALPAQEFAAAALGQAIELFADAKGLIELAYAQQQGINALLAPGEAADPRPGAERTAAALAQTSTNQGRLARLERLLAEEAASAAAGQDADPAPGQPADEAAADDEARQAAQVRQEQAEALRLRAAAGLDTLANALAAADGGAPPASARPAADETLAALDALRRLYFSIVEHLQALRQEQADTHDQTATLQFETSTDASAEAVGQLEPVAERQAQHETFGDALADALAQQADAANAAAAQAPTTDDGEPATAEGEALAGERFAEAAAEVRQASGRMAAAKAVLTEVAARAGAMSPELEPALADQQAALDHLDAALAALAPPEGQEKQQGQGQSGGGEQAQQPPAEDAVSQRQALRRLQAIRDREAQRTRQRAGANEQTPVEKDW